MLPVHNGGPMLNTLRRTAILALLTLSARADATPVYFPGNGHTYELVEVQTTWAGAVAAASAATYAGYSGHLATITTAEENSFISSTFASGQAQYFAWLGGHEPNDDGIWLWGAGPEAGVQFATGNAASPPYNYVNWHGIEPNDFANGEDFLAINLGGTFAAIGPGGWGDSPNPNPADPIKAYIVEYETTLSGVANTPDAALRIRSVAPNPFDAFTRIEFAHSGGSLDIGIFDVRGRRVRRLLQRNETRGDHVIEWDGRDDAGRSLSAGVYFYVIRSKASQVTGKTLLVR